MSKNGDSPQLAAGSFNIIEENEENMDFKAQNNAPCFSYNDRRFQETAGLGLLGKIQDMLKKYGKLYCFLVRVFAPVYLGKSYDDQIEKMLKKSNKSDIILNIGSGPAYFKNRKDIINVDFFAFNEVDIVANCKGLPIKKDTVDLIFNVALLEHVKNPEIAVHEMFRILKPGARVFCYLQFVAPFHPAPDDYQRWTLSGTRELFHEFNNVETGIGAGPTSGMLWVLQEWIAILLSFGSKNLHDIIFLTLMLLTFPLKYIDILMVKFPNSEKIASGFYVVAKK